MHVRQGGKARVQVDGRGHVHRRQSVFDIHVVVQGNQGEDKDGLCECMCALGEAGRCCARQQGE